MDRFLDEVARDLYNRYGADVGECRMLFPSRRARLFFAESLCEVAERAMWEPRWVAIDDLMATIAGVPVGERVRLIAELYRVYVEYHPTETFDRFYSWGEVLLRDFDMVDKYMVDPDQLFRNVADIKEIESDLSYLSEAQQRIVAFWSTIGAEEDLSRHKRRFLKVWLSLAPIYHKFRERLLALGVGYSGMVHRIAAERIKSGEWRVGEGERYVVAGFNALSKCEKVLFDELKRGDMTHFYWDWDDYYANDKRQEAGLFINKNRERYPSAAQISHDNFAREKSIDVVATSSSVLQCKYVARILQQIVDEGGVIDKNTAIVLTDESLLLPLLHALPKWVGRVNVTMGYPLRQSLAYSFVERLIALQNHARSSSSGAETLYHVDVVGILSHPYLEAGVGRETLLRIERAIRSERLISVPVTLFGGDELLSRIFRVVQGWSDISSYIVDTLQRIATLPDEQSHYGEQRVEFLSFLIDEITSLQNCVAMCNVELSTSTYLSLLRRHLQPLRIPFEGEPLEGLQVMGILETRTLDFERVILLSMNDDNFPADRSQQPSYIPYNLRFAYSMPTPEHHDGVYAYYFYRLIQRAKSVSLIYCSSADDKSTGEQSRYITQLDYESPFTLHRVDVGVDVNLSDGESIEIAKRGEVAAQLSAFYLSPENERQRTLSPTALYQYVACPLRFYFRSLARISVKEELSEEVDAPMFGTLLHVAMERLYNSIEGAKNMAKALSTISDQQVEEAVDHAIRTSYLKGSQSAGEMSGNLILVREVVSRYIKGGVLRYDSAHADFRVEGNEKRIGYDVELRGGERVRIEGICDRIDRMANGAFRIVDYKTGSEHLEFDGIEPLFSGGGKQKLTNVFQTLLYSYMLYKSDPRREILPSLYYVRGMHKDDYSPLLLCKEVGEDGKKRGEITSYAPYHEEFERWLYRTLEELFDKDLPFRQCGEEDVETTCAYCDYKSICRRT